MPKVKTKSGAKKRFKVTKNGKVVHALASASHLLEGKSSKRKRHLRGNTVADKTEMNHIKRMMPYA